LGECGDTAGVRIILTSVNLLPPERNREAMDDELIVATVSGDDTALR